MLRGAGMPACPCVDERFFELSDAFLEFVGEFGEEALGGPGASFTEGADRAAGDVVGDVFKVLGVVGACALVHDTGGDL